MKFSIKDFISKCDEIRRNLKRYSWSFNKIYVWILQPIISRGFFQDANENVKVILSVDKFFVDFILLFRLNPVKHLRWSFLRN